MGKNSNWLIITISGLGLVLASCGSGEVEQDTAEPIEATREAAPDVAEPVEMSSPVKMAKVDVIRGPGGLEEKCLAKVAEITGAPVLGTNRIEESEAAIEVYVNVQDAQAPWKCLGGRDGSLGDVEYSGSEGEL